MKPNTAALIEKQAKEKLSAFRRGRFDLAGFLLRVILTGLLAVLFAVFFSKFAGVYIGVKSSGAAVPEQRLSELLTLVYFLLFLSSAVGSAIALSREFFDREDLKLLSAMPVSARSIYFSALFTVLLGQLIFALVTIVPINLVAAQTLPQGTGFYLRTLLIVVLLPLFSVSVGSVLSLPCSAFTRFLRMRYLLTLILVTLLAAGGFWVYAKLLGGVKELLLGDDLKYFFSERVMSGISALTTRLYPANLLAGFVLGRTPLRKLYKIMLPLGVLLVLSLILVRSMMQRGVKSRTEGKSGGRGTLSRALPVLLSLMKKELLEILRTPGYAFSCFSIAALLPLMVYFCMSVGSSLVYRLIGLNCNAELALFLTLLFGALSNVFCSTNISREGENFYLLKALPVSAEAVFSSKLLFQLGVSTAAQGISALLLYFTRFIDAKTVLLVFFAGTFYSIAQICFATRYDFSRARFSSEEDGRAAESGGAVSAVILFGMLTSFVLGGGALAVKLFSALRLSKGFGSYPLYAAGGITLLIALFMLFFFYRNLKRRYYEFSGGGLI